MPNKKSNPTICYKAFTNAANRVRPVNARIIISPHHNIFTSSSSIIAAIRGHGVTVRLCVSPLAALKAGLDIVKASGQRCEEWVFSSAPT